MEQQTDRAMWGTVALIGFIVMGGVLILKMPDIIETFQRKVRESTVAPTDNGVDINSDLTIVVSLNDKYIGPASYNRKQVLEEVRDQVQLVKINKNKSGKDTVIQVGSSPKATYKINEEYGTMEINTGIRLGELSDYDFVQFQPPEPKQALAEGNKYRAAFFFQDAFSGYQGFLYNNNSPIKEELLIFTHKSIKSPDTLRNYLIERQKLEDLKSFVPAFALDSYAKAVSDQADKVGTYYAQPEIYEQIYKESRKHGFQSVVYHKDQIYDGFGNVMVDLIPVLIK